MFRGHDGLKKFFGAWYEAWDVVKPDLEELIDAGDQVIAIETTRGRGRESGLSVELPHVSVWTIRKGKIIQAQWFATRDEARLPIGPALHLERARVTAAKPSTKCASR